MSHVESFFADPDLVAGSPHKTGKAGKHAAIIGYMSAKRRKRRQKGAALRQ
jgi:hypothetical protein